MFCINIGILLGILDLRMPFFEEGFVGFAEISKGDAESLGKIHHEWEREREISLGERKEEEEGRKKERKKRVKVFILRERERKERESFSKLSLCF